MSVKYPKEFIIDHRSTVSVSDQIYKQLEGFLSSAKVVNDQSLMSAEQLASMLEVEEKIIQDVYQKLEKNQFIYFDDEQKPHSSRYKRILDFLSQYSSIEEGIESTGKESSTEIVEIKIIESNHSSFIDLTNLKDKRLFKQSRLYKVDGKPYMFLEEFYPIDRFPKLLEIDQVNEGNLFRTFLSNEYDIQFEKNERLIKIQIIDAKMAQRLNVNKGLSHFVAEMTYYDQKNRSFGYAKAYSLPYFYFDYDIKIK